MGITTQALLAWVDAIGWTLLHFLWQGTVLGVFYAVLRPAFPGVTARYRLGMSMLTAMLVCPLVTLFYLWPDYASQAAAVVALPAVTVGGGTPATGIASASLQTWLPWLVGAWFAGATIIAIRAFAHWRRLRWLVRNASIPLTDCADVLARLCRRFGVSQRIRLLGSMGVDTPMLVGWIKPVILLPISMLSGFTPQQVELIIAHELGHVRRWDYLANLLQVVIETVLFYHPAVHWISRDVRDARESCCDDLVLALADGSPVVYASALADLEQLRHDGGFPAPALAASGGVLLDRIRRIVGGQSVLCDPLPRSGGWPIALLAAAGLIAALRLHAPPADIAATLRAMPAASVAAISGNPKLVSEPAVAPAPATTTPGGRATTATAVAPAKADVASTNRNSAFSDTVETNVITPVGRPHITVATALPEAKPRVADIRESISALPALLAPPATEEIVQNTMPVPLRRVQPEYPLHEKIRGITGRVDLQFSIDADGNVSDIRVVQSTPDHEFDRVAIAALKQWRFSAAGDNGRLYTQSFAFTLGAAAAAAETCRDVTGSHICRRVAAGEESDY